MEVGDPKTDPDPQDCNAEKLQENQASYEYSYVCESDGTNIVLKEGTPPIEPIEKPTLDTTDSNKTSTENITGEEAPFETTLDTTDSNKTSTENITGEEAPFPSNLIDNSDLTVRVNISDEVPENILQNTMKFEEGVEKTANHVDTEQNASDATIVEDEEALNPEIQSEKNNQEIRDVAMMTPDEQIVENVDCIESAHESGESSTLDSKMDNLSQSAHISEEVPENILEQAMGNANVTEETSNRDDSLNPEIPSENVSEEIPGTVLEVPIATNSNEEVATANLEIESDQLKLGPENEEFVTQADNVEIETLLDNCVEGSIEIQVSEVPEVTDTEQNLDELSQVIPRDESQLQDEGELQQPNEDANLVSNDSSNLPQPENAGEEELDHQTEVILSHDGTDLSQDLTVGNEYVEESVEITSEALQQEEIVVEKTVEEQMKSLMECDEDESETIVNTGEVAENVLLEMLQASTALKGEKRKLEFENSSINKRPVHDDNIEPAVEQSGLIAKLLSTPIQKRNDEIITDGEIECLLEEYDGANQVDDQRPSTSKVTWADDVKEGSETETGDEADLRNKSQNAALRDRSTSNSLDFDPHNLLVAAGSEPMDDNCYKDKYRRKPTGRRKGKKKVLLTRKKIRGAYNSKAYTPKFKNIPVVKGNPTLAIGTYQPSSGDYSYTEAVGNNSWNKQTQTSLSITWKNFLSMDTLSDAEIRPMLGFNMLKIQTWGKQLMAGNEIISSKPNLKLYLRLVLITIWKYRFNLNFDTYEYMLGGSSIQNSFLLGVTMFYKHLFVQHQMKMHDKYVAGTNNGLSTIFYLDVLEVPVEYHKFYDEINISDSGRPTFKVFYAFNSNREFVFISNVYAGSTSLELMIQESSFLEILKLRGKVVSPENIRLETVTELIPYLIYFSNKELYVSFDEMKRNITSKYKILKDDLPFCYWPYAKQIVQSCCILYNQK